MTRRWPPADSRRGGAKGKTSKGMARRLGIAVALLAGALVAACATRSPEDDVAGRVRPATTGSVVAAAPATPSSPPAPDFQGLVGLSAADLRRLLGEPDFRRQESLAEFWQYRTADCVLDLFLYSDGSAYRVVHADTRDRGFLRVSQSNCYGALVQARSGRPRQSILSHP